MSGALGIVTFAPRRFSWRGRVHARALFFAELDAAAVVAEWSPSARIYACDGGALVVLGAGSAPASSSAATARSAPGDRFIDARVAHAEVLVDVDGVLSAIPLTKKEREPLGRGCVVRARGGLAYVTPMSILSEVDPASLVDVSGLRLVAVEPLGVPAPIVPPPPKKKLDMRAELLGDAAPNPQRELAAKAFHDAHNGATPAAAGSGANDAAANNNGLVDAGANANNALEKAQLRAAQGVPADGIGESMLRAVVKALEATGLMDKLRKAHRDYIEDTLAMLQKGDLDDALKRAIPLARPGMTAPKPKPEPIGLPGAVRPNLSFNPKAPRTSSATSINLEAELFARLRESYRDAARKLEKEKRFKEAAFVHVELLGDFHEAVACLERSGDKALLQLAAEIAEANSLPPSLIVRQWVVAGDMQKAVELARRHHVFADAVMALERSSRTELARTLRLEWAEHHASIGEHANAVDVALPAGAVAADAVRRYLEAGITAGGVDMPRLVGRRVMMDAAEKPKEPPQDLKHLQAIVDDDGPDAAAARMQLAYALTAVPAHLRSSTSPLMRALYADVAAGASPASMLSTLSERLADAALRADKPADPPPRPRRHPSQVVVLDGPPGRAIARSVAPLPGGRVVVGLGEAGAMVVTRKGGAQYRTSEPCERLIVSDARDRVVLVAQRGIVLRLARMNVATGKAKHWIDVRAHACCATTDGDLVLVARDNDLLGFDALADTAKVMWQTALDGPALAFARDGIRLAVVVEAAAPHIAFFDGKTLAYREQRPAPPFIAGIIAGGAYGGVSPNGDVVAFDGPAPVQVSPANAFLLNTPAGSIPSAPLAVARGICAVGWDGDDNAGFVVHAQGHPRLVCELRDARPTALHVFERTVAVADDRGRVFIVDADRGEVLQRLALP